MSKLLFRLGLLLSTIVLALFAFVAFSGGTFSLSAASSSSSSPTATAAAKIVVLLRGHVRNALDDDALYDFLWDMWRIQPFELFVHTWSIRSNSLSWRKIERDSRNVSAAMVKRYLAQGASSNKNFWRRFLSLRGPSFDDASVLRALRIDDDLSLPLIGPTDGLLNGVSPRLGWKAYWAGQHAMVQPMLREYQQHQDNNNVLVVNTRFDVLRNSNNFDRMGMLALYRLVARDGADRIMFLRHNERGSNKTFAGCDNFYVGPLSKMAKLIHNFHHHLEEVRNRPGHFPYDQELLVMKEARRL